MINRPLTFKLIRDLWHRRVTLVAVMLVIAIGIGTYISMAGVYLDLDHARANYYQKYRLADFTIDLKRAPETAVVRLNNIPNVLRLQSRIKTEVMVNLPNKSYQQYPRAIPGVALSLPVPRKDLINDILLYKGHWFSNSYAHEVIIDQQFAKERNLVPGDRILVRLPAQQYNLLIVGTSFSPEFTMILPPGGVIAPEPRDYAVMYMPRKFLQESSDLNSVFNQLIGLSSNKNQTALENTMSLISSKLDSYGVQLKTPQQEQISVKVLHDELVNVKTVTTLFPTMFLLIAILVLNVMLNRLITQQKNIIGILKAIGYTNAELITHFLFYGIIIGILGGILGIAIGIWLEHLMLVVYRTYFAIPNIVLFIHKQVLITGMMISIASALLGSSFAAFKAIRLNPAEAMRPPTPESSVHIIFEKISWLWGKLTFQSKMVLRAIFRSRFRTLTTIAANILATTLIFSSLAFTDCMDKMIAFSFDHLQHQDYLMTLREPLGKNIIRSMQTLPGVKLVEPQLAIVAKLRFGQHEKRLNVTGLPENHKLYTPITDKGKPISIPKTGLILTKTLAKLLHVKVGQNVELQPLIGYRQKVKAQVSGIFTSYLGLSAYADQSWLSHLLGDSWVANTILFKLDNHKNFAKFIDATNKYASMINFVKTERAKQVLIKTFNEFIIFFISLMIAFAGIIAIGSIINTAMISLNERERDVASLRVIGHSNLQVARIFIGESLLLNIIGTILGLGGGILYLYYTSIAFSTEIYRMPVVIKPSRLIETILIMLSFAVLSQIIIYRFICKMDWFAILNIRE